MKEKIIQWMHSYYTHNGVFDARAWESDKGWWDLGLIAGLVAAAFIVWIASRYTIVQIVHVVALRSKSKWDDHLVHNKVFKGMALLVPLMFMESMMSIAFHDFPVFLTYTNKLVLVDRKSVV